MGAFETIPVGDTSARLYVAGAGSTTSPGVLVLHPWWGLNDDVIAYADRLADTGFTVAAPDMFGGQVATAVEDAERLAHAADEEAVNVIVLAALDRLAEGLDASARLARLSDSRSVRTGRSGARPSAIASSPRSCTTARPATT